MTPFSCAIGEKMELNFRSIMCRFVLVSCQATLRAMPRHATPRHAAALTLLTLTGPRFVRPHSLDSLLFLCFPHEASDSASALSYSLYLSFSSSSVSVWTRNWARPLFLLLLEQTSHRAPRPHRQSLLLFGACASSAPPLLALSAPCSFA